MIRRPPRSTRTDTLFPYTTLFRSAEQCSCQQKIKGELHQAFPISSRTSVKRPVIAAAAAIAGDTRCVRAPGPRSEEHTSELQSLMRISYAVFCLKKKKQKTTKDNRLQTSYNNHNTILTDNPLHMHRHTS